jgi:hypothetical protein
MTLLRKVFSILLMALLLFNWIGYRLVINYLQERADHQLQARIDINNYDDAQLMEIRVALNMPYQAVNTSFERHYGEIEIGGESYTYVKRKVEDGFLVLKCLPNHQKDVLKNNGNTYFNTTNGIDQENGKTAVPFSKVVKAFTSEFDNGKPLFQLEQPVMASIVLQTFTAPFVTSGFLTIPAQPPETA